MTKIDPTVELYAQVGILLFDHFWARHRRCGGSYLFRPDHKKFCEANEFTEYGVFEPRASSWECYFWDKTLDEAPSFVLEIQTRIEEKTGGQVEIYQERFKEELNVSAPRPYTVAFYYGGKRIYIIQHEEKSIALSLLALKLATFIKAKENGLLHSNFKK